MAEDPADPDLEESEAAFDLFWNIPDEFDALDVDIVSRACVGAPEDVDTGETEPDNCNDDAEDSIRLDDAQDTPFPTVVLPTGEITGICVGSQADCDDEDTDFDATQHGDVIVEGSFAVLFRTSDDVSNASACLDNLTTADNPAANEDPAREPTECDDYADNVFETEETTDTATEDFREWIAFFNAVNVTDQEDFDLAIFGDPEPDVGECAEEFADAADANAASGDFEPTETDICVFDQHYLVVTEEEVAAEEGAALTFQQTEDDTPEAVDCTEDEDFDTERDNFVEAENDVEEEDIVGCLFNQRGDPITTADVTFEIESGPGEFVEPDSDDCNAEDVDDDPADTLEVCTAADEPAAGGETGNGFDATIANLEDNRGTVVVRFCEDAEAGDTDHAEFGCEDEDNVATLTKNFVGEPEHVHLVFLGEDEEPTAELCHTGDSFRTNNVGDTDTLLVCTMDEDENLVGTGPDEAGRLSMTIDSENNAVVFATSPPRETDDGTATVDVRARAEGSADIIVNFEAEAGTETTDDTDQVTKVVEEAEEPPPPDGREIPCTITGTDGPDNLTGTEGDDVICGFGGDDTLSGLGGDDIIAGGFGSDTFNGGAGQDTLEGDEINSCLEGGEACGSPGSDTLNGGDGKDTARGDDGNDVFNGGDKNDLLVGGGGDDELNGENGWDTIRGNVGDDTLRGARGRDILQGGVGNDTARGGSNDDTIRGFTGSDRLIGHAGDDIIKGGTGNDTLRGGSGDDILNGGAGRDSCRGGPGSDVLRRCETR